MDLAVGKNAKLNVYKLTDDLIRTRLATFEERTGMTSAQFLERYNRSELGDDPMFIDWAGLLYIASKTGVVAPVSA